MIQQKVKLENITVGSKYFIKRTNMKTFLKAENQFRFIIVVLFYILLQFTR